MRYQINPERRRIGASLIASIATHLLLAVLLAVVAADRPKPVQKAPKSMDVVMLDDRKEPVKRAEKDAKAIANVTARGGSRQAEDRTTRQALAPAVSRQPVPAPPRPEQRPRTPPPPPAQQQQPRMLARRGPAPEESTIPKLPEPEKKAEKQPSRKPEPARKAKPAPPEKEQVQLSELMPSAMALSQLSNRMQRERRMKQELSREADVPINTREAKYAPYAHALVRALEEQWRPGQANYREFPEDARRSLIRLTIEKSGDLGGVEILRPSPIPEINESAIRAIHAAAPFKVLPSSWGLDRVSFYLTFEVIEDKYVFRPM